MPEATCGAVEDGGYSMHGITERIQEILTEHFWPPSLKTDTTYARRHDDTDGQNEGYIGVHIDASGDVWFQADTTHSLRFRTWGGGGQSLRTRNALLILADAIRLDNQELPQNVEDVTE